jgi:hypothetical protein
MQVMNIEIGEMPIEQTLCIFKFNQEYLTGRYILGSLYFENNEFVVVEYLHQNKYDARDFTRYQQIQEDNGQVIYYSNRRIASLKAKK